MTVGLLKGDASQIIPVLEPEKVLINMEVNYFQVDTLFSPMCNYSEEMQDSPGLPYSEPISAITQEENGVVISES